MPQNSPPTTAKGFVQLLSVIHLVFFGIVLAFAVFAFFFSENVGLELEEVNGFFIIGIPVLLIGSIVLGNFLFKKILAQAHDKIALKEKLQIYQISTFIRYVLVEGPALFALMALILTGNLVYLLLASICLVYLYYLKPGKEKIKQDLQLSGEALRKFTNDSEKL
ncbi:hypothetical protein ACFQO1_12015 [Jejudonia soesokkakensis]|uniref:MFS transporter n=1 Tax=Jejudonia soesokkakensis TaxID=1323432 RepID=A0ABW2MTY8_9FLAO